MPTVVDSNILFSSLIRKSTTRMILASSNMYFVVPEWVHYELREHIGELAGKAGVPETDMETFLEEIFEIVHTVPLEEYKSHLAEAMEVMAAIDSDDAPFLAVALATGAEAIWTQDKHFLEQNLVRVISTREMMEMLGGQIGERSEGAD